MRLAITCAALISLAGCTSVPKGLQPVSGFDVDRYMGRWYEIARLDHSFERNLSNVSAEYTLRGDGKILVVNRGYSETKRTWKEARGVAKFRGDKSVGSLKVTFFWPFYGGYHIIALDRDDYAYAMVAGPSRSYLWILAREPELEKETLEDLVSKAEAWGFATHELIFVDQSMAVE